MIDEIRAFELATEAARKRGWPWRPAYWLRLEDGKWEVGAMSESDEVVTIDSESGEVFFNDPPLDPLRALSIAREYAQAQNLTWTPQFSVELRPEYWQIGTGMDRLGGNVHIHVRHNGT